MSKIRGKKVMDFSEFSVLNMMKNLAGPTLSELLYWSYGYGLTEEEVKHGLALLLKDGFIVPMPVESISMEFFYNFLLSEKGRYWGLSDDKEELKINKLVSEWWLSGIGKKEKGEPYAKARKMLESMYVAQYGALHMSVKIDDNTEWIENPIFAAEIYKNIAKEKLNNSETYEAARYFLTSALCYEYARDVKNSKKYFILAASYFKENRDLDRSLMCYTRAMSYSSEDEKKKLIESLPLPDTSREKIHPNNFQESLASALEELNEFTNKQILIDSIQYGGILALLTNRFEEHFKEAIHENDGEKLKIASRFFHYTMEIFEHIFQKNDDKNFEEYEISKKLEIANVIGNIYEDVANRFIEGYLPSEEVKNTLLNIYTLIDRSVVHPLVLLFNGLITGGKELDSGAYLVLFEWKSSELRKSLKENLDIIYSDIEKNKSINDLLERRGCTLTGKSPQGKRIDKIISDFPNTYMEIFNICEKEEVLKKFISLKSDEIKEDGFSKTEREYLLKLGVFYKKDGSVFLQKDFFYGGQESKNFWKTGDWLVAYLISVLKKEEIELLFCENIQDRDKALYEIDLLISNKKNTLCAIECKTKVSLTHKIGMDEIKKFFSVIETLKPIKHNTFVGWPHIESHAEIYADSKNIHCISSKDNLNYLKEFLSDLTKKIKEEG